MNVKSFAKDDMAGAEDKTRENVDDHGQIRSQIGDSWGHGVFIYSWETRCAISVQYNCATVAQQHLC